MIEIENSQEFYEIVETYPTVVVAFGAPSWCVPCQRLEPHFRAASGVFVRTIFLSVDIEAVPELRQDFDIMSVPTVLFLSWNAEGFLERKSILGRTALAIVKEVTNAR